MSGVESAQHIDDDAHRESHRQTLAPLLGEAHELVERYAVDEFEDDEGFAVRVDDVDALNDVGMTDTGREARLVHEERAHVRIFEQVAMQPLDGDDAIRAAHAREMNGGVTAARDVLEDGVATEAQEWSRNGPIPRHGPGIVDFSLVKIKLSLPSRHWRRR